MTSSRAAVRESYDRRQNVCFSSSSSIIIGSVGNQVQEVIHSSIEKARAHGPSSEPTGFTRNYLNISKPNNSYIHSSVIDPCQAPFMIHAQGPHKMTFRLSSTARPSLAGLMFTHGVESALDKAQESYFRRRCCYRDLTTLSLLFPVCGARTIVQHGAKTYRTGAEDSEEACFFFSLVAPFLHSFWLLHTLRKTKQKTVPRSRSCACLRRPKEMTG